MTPDRFEQYLFRSHSRAELQAWAKRLRYFRFCRALGGLANDGDCLAVALRHRGEADAQHLLASLSDAQRNVSVSLTADTLQLTLAGANGDPYEVTEADVANAEALERRLDPHAERIIDPPLNDPRCIAPATYPAFWT
jgi:hypothetical protein